MRTNKQVIAARRRRVMNQIKKMAEWRGKTLDDVLAVDIAKGGLLAARVSSDYIYGPMTIDELRVSHPDDMLWWRLADPLWLFFSQEDIESVHGKKVTA